MTKLLTTIIAISFSFNGWAFEKPSREEVIEYFEVTNAIKALEGYSKSYIAVLKEGYPNLENNFYSDPEFIKSMDRYNEKLLDEWIYIIRNNMSKNNLEEISTFLKTELGQKVITLNKITGPLFNEAATKTNIWLNEKVGRLLYKHGAN